MNLQSINMKRIFSILFAVCALFLDITKANNLNISNVSAPSTTTIQFDIAWDNSWNITGINYDAVWVFVKAQVCGGSSTPYTHANLSAAGNSVSGGVLQIDLVSDNKGVFIRRAANGTGNIATATVTLTFATSYVTANTNFEVIGIEMVYVPTGSFTVGDGSTINGTHSTASFGSNNSTPRPVASEAAMAQDYLRNDKAGDAAITAHAAIIAGFPKGYNAFYCMKYEISQQQYVTFLNLLDFNQQAARTSAAPSSATGTLVLTTSGNENRNYIKIVTPGNAASAAIYGNDFNNNGTFNEAGDGQNIACNYLSWDDLKAYLDWAALRPMTELEYEKACRGVNSSLLNEYAWGSTSINQAISSSLTNSGQSGELSTSTADGLCAYLGGASTTLGPLRTGFAATLITGRTGAGASYWGILDLSGNVWEQTYQCGYYNGAVRTSVPIFTGLLGDGEIDATGNADATNWGGGVALSVVKGGNWEYTAQRAQVSDRFYINSTAQNSSRTSRTGGRGVRQP
jgi:formylglycine-generating enzyme required for sulfatase activity